MKKNTLITLIGLSLFALVGCAQKVDTTPETGDVETAPPPDVNVHVDTPPAPAPEVNVEIPPPPPVPDVKVEVPSPPPVPAVPDENANPPSSGSENPGE